MNKEKIIKNIEEIDKRISMRYVVNNLKFKNFKNIQIAVTLTSILAAGALGYNTHKYLDPNNFKQSSVYESIEPINNIDEANDEVVINYINGSFSDFCDYVGQGNTSASVDQVEAFRTSYYIPTLEAYDDFKETNNQDYYNKFKKSAREYENRIIDYNPNLAFNKTIYKYAKYIDGELYVPYDHIIDNSTLPSNAKVEENIVYVPLNTLDKYEAKTLGND